MGVEPAPYPRPVELNREHSGEKHAISDVMVGAHVLISPAETGAIFRVENLSKIYRSGDSQLAIFESLNFEVKRGERLALVGESGAGKSTLLHLLGGLDRPSNGTIYYLSKD